MSVIYVKTKAGRIAFDAPRGNRIPGDRFVPVVETKWINNLIHNHGDLEVQPKKAHTPAVPAADKSTVEVVSGETKAKKADK